MNTSKPYTLPVRPDNIPSQLKSRPQWVCWEWTYLPKDDRWTKTPKAGNDTAKWGSSTDPTTWGSFDDAYRRHLDLEYSGIGYVLTADDGFVGIDIDKCRDRETGKYHDETAYRIYHPLNTYTEISPSGTGLRIFALADFPAEGRGRKHERCEIYAHGRYLCMTGHHVGSTPKTIEPRQEAVNRFFEDHFPADPVKERQTKERAERVREHRPASISDQKIISKVKSTGNGAALWAGDLSENQGDHSRADLALCGLIAFYSGPDEDAIDRIFRLSDLYRDKWERDDYRERTIGMAMDRDRFFDWSPPSPETIPDAPGSTQTAPEPPKGFPVALSIADLDKMKPPTWLIKHHLPTGGMAMLKGASGAHKTFLALDMALSVATGEDYQGHRVRQGPVFFIAGEGGSGIRARIRAWLQERRLDPPKNFFVLPIPLPLGDDPKEGIIQLDKSIEHAGIRPALLVIDTLARNFGCGCEDNTKDMMSFVKKVDVVRRKYDVATLIIHHTRHSDDKERGNTSLRGACDSILAIKAAQGGTLVSCEKQKDASPFPCYVLRTKEVELPYRNEDGDRITSLILKIQAAADTDWQMLKAEEKDVIRWLYHQKGGSIRRTAEALDVSKNIMERRLRGLRGRHWLTGSDDGYTTTDKVKTWMVV